MWPWLPWVQVPSLTPLKKSAPVAQLDRAPDFESVGRGFESLRACHKHQGFTENKICKPFFIWGFTGGVIVNTLFILLWLNGSSWFFVLGYQFGYFFPKIPVVPENLDQLNLLTFLDFRIITPETVLNHGGLDFKS